MQHLGLSQSSRDVFIILEQANIIETALSGKLQAMVEFRNIAVRNYTQLNLATVQAIIQNNLMDFLHFTKKILEKQQAEL